MVREIRYFYNILNTKKYELQSIKDVTQTEIRTDESSVLELSTKDWEGIHHQTLLHTEGKPLGLIFTKLF